MLVPLDDIFEAFSNFVQLKNDAISELVNSLKKEMLNEELIKKKLRALHYLLLYKLCIKQPLLYTDYLEVVDFCTSRLVNEEKNCISYVNSLADIVEISLSCLPQDDSQKAFDDMLNLTKVKLIKLVLEKNESHYSRSLCNSFKILDKLCSLTLKQYKNAISDCQFIIPESYTQYLIELYFELPAEHCIALGQCIFPKMLYLQVEMLDKLWFCIETLYPQKLDKMLIILTIMMDFYVDSNYSLNFHCKNIFWEIIQDGLIHENQELRKRSLYILRTLITSFKDSNKFNKVIELECFFWDPDKTHDLLKFWDCLFILFDVTEEKQEHIVTASLKKINEAIEISISMKKISFGYSWIFPVFIRLLTHPSVNVIKWAITTVTHIDVNYVAKDRKFNILLSCFIEALNNTFLYNSCDEYETRSATLSSIETMFISVSASEFHGVIFELILDILVQKQFNHIPLFYIIDALSKVPLCPSWGLNTVDNIKKIVSDIRTKQCLFLRTTIQNRLLNCIFCLANEQMTFSSIIDILSSFDSKKCLKRGTHAWNNCVEFIKKYLIREDIKEIARIYSSRLFESLASHQLYTSALVTVLFFDTKLLENISQIFLEPIFDQFSCCSKRPYSSHTIQDSCLLYLTYLIEFHELNYVDITKNDLLHLIDDKMDNLLDYINGEFLTGNANEGKIILYIQSLKCFYNIYTIALESSSKMCKKAFQSLDKNDLLLTTEYFSLNVIILHYKVLLNHYKNETSKISVFEENIEVLLRKRLLDHSLVRKSSQVGQLKSERGKLHSEIINILWNIFGTYLSNNSGSLEKSLIFSIDNITEAGFEGIQKGGKIVLESILKSFKFLLPLNHNVEEILRFIHESWEACFELRKSDLFWKSVEAWISMTFQEAITEKIALHSCLFDYADTIMEVGCEVTGLVNLLFIQLQKLSTSVNYFSRIIVKGLVFHPILKKDKRYEDNILRYIVSRQEADRLYVEKEEIDKMAWRTDLEVRLLSLNMLLSVANKRDRDLLVISVIQELIQTDHSLTKNNKRYFNNSAVHRKKHKILQAILILEFYIKNNYTKDLQPTIDAVFNWTFESLKGDNQQPSVRYMLEWLFVRICLHYPTIVNNFWNIFEEAGNQRLGSLCSFMSIAYHLAMALKNEEFLDQLVQNVFPWCMAQNFTLRLYAQVVLSKIWALSDNISEKYSILKTNQWKVQEQGNVLTNAKKMLTDFYFDAFDPMKHFTLKTIYWDLPRLSKLSSEEWLPHKTVVNCLTALKCFENLLAEDKTLDGYSAPLWVTRTPDSTANSDDTLSVSVQKKFVPWKGLETDFDGNDKAHNSKGLILLASLIDKPSNLGGLSRTCEVLGAKQLVLSNFDLAKDKEFQSLSMTAERHINIMEVKPHDVKKYLEDIKSLGYQLIGAEQSTGSVSLKNFTFPEKCVLLLGNEREGIPANLIPLMDQCVEIPQAGLVRSLNVHVSGAIFLWEYFKEHYQK